ncbi:MAG TPA: LysR family transcriptional regulator [Caulobacterales bacterium]|jgi:DNA-binding transcriptional LysR family regulator|nr:LysR family transcriptional regulator [Caulobacterales bacterium]
MSDFSDNDIRRLDGGLLLVFRELLRTRRATAVARRLGLSQSGVSHALTRLRDLFGDPLFVRRPHGLEPTRRALELGPRVEALIDLAGATIAREGGFDPARSARRFSIAAPEHATVMIGPPLIRALRAQAPRVSFAQVGLFGDPALDGVRRGEIDVALGRFNAPPPGLAMETLYEDEYCAIARRGHPRIKRRLTEKAFRETGHVFVDATGIPGSVEDPLPDPREVATVAIVPRWLTVMTLVAASDLIGSCPRRLAERHAEMFGLQILSAPFAPWKMTISLVKRDAPDAGADWFVAQIRAAANA